MNLLSQRNSLRWTNLALPMLTLGLACLSPGRAKAEPIYALTTTNGLLRFDSATPGTLQSSVGITGLQTGEELVGFDLRPATGQLFGLSTTRMYSINPTTGVATQVGSTGAFTLSGAAFGVDFNPTVDRLRVVSNTGQNLRLNPNDGTLAGTDTPLNPGTPSVVGAAYTNSFAGATTTTLFDIDSVADNLVTQGGLNGVPSPNLGQLFPIGPLNFNTSDLVGFDISGLSGIAYASLTAPTGTTSSLYTINLNTGAAALVGTIGGGVTIRDITAATTPEPTSIVMFGTGVVGLVGFSLRRRIRKA